MDDGGIIGKKTDFKTGHFQTLSSARICRASCGDGSRLPYTFIDMRFKLREIVDELLDQFSCSAIIFFLVRPCFARIKNGAINARYRNRIFKSEIAVPAEFDIAKRAVERRIEQSPRRLDRHPLNARIGSLPARPAGVDQPTIGPALGDPLFQQITIYAGMARHEGRAKAGGESRRRLGHADFGSRDARSIAGQESGTSPDPASNAQSAATRHKHRR